MMGENRRCIEQGDWGALELDRGLSALLDVRHAPIQRSASPTMGATPYCNTPLSTPELDPLPSLTTLHPQKSPA